MLRDGARGAAGGGRRWLSACPFWGKKTKKKKKGKKKEKLKNKIQKGKRSPCLQASHSEVNSRGARPSRFSFGVRRGGRLGLLFCLFFFLFLLLSAFSLLERGNSHRDPRERKKRGGGKEGGKGAKPAGVAQPTGCRGRSGGAGGFGEVGPRFHTRAHTHTHSSQRTGRRQVEKGAKFLENQCPAIIASKQSRGEKRKTNNAGEGRGDAKLPFPLSSSAGGEKVSPDAASCWEAWYEAKLCFDRLCSTLPLSSSRICKGKRKKKKTKRVKKKSFLQSWSVLLQSLQRSGKKSGGRGKKRKERKKIHFVDLPTLFPWRSF
ncbi:uncharacterized protein LOC135417313 [Pseudopipra pipra]|uniref:uncharacterized protein LOC135417313 n=1 Tax=Pseudopipra pipra TaxID=415032 RepID=UPI003139A8B9